MVTGLKAKIIGQIIELLTVHTYVENEVMYPEVRALLPELEDDVPDRVSTSGQHGAVCVLLEQGLLVASGPGVIGQVAGSELDEAYRASWRGLFLRCGVRRLSRARRAAYLRLAARWQFPACVAAVSNVACTRVCPRSTSGRPRTQARRLAPGMWPAGGFRTASMLAFR